MAHYHFHFPDPKSGARPTSRTTPLPGNPDTGIEPVPSTPWLQSTYLQESETLQVSAPRFSRSVRPSQAPHVGMSIDRIAEHPSEKSTRRFSLTSERQPEQRNRSRSRRRTRRGSRTSRRSSPSSQSITHVSSITNTYPENPMFPSVPAPQSGESQQSMPEVVPAAASPFHPKPQFVPPQSSPFFQPTIATNTPTPLPPGHFATPSAPPPPASPPPGLFHSTSTFTITTPTCSCSTTTLSTPSTIIACSSRAIQSTFFCCLCLKREDGIICMVHFYIADDFTLGLLLRLLIQDRMLDFASIDFCNVETFVMLN